jgi:hypothetical protein
MQGFPLESEAIDYCEARDFCPRVTGPACEVKVIGKLMWMHRCGKKQIRLVRKFKMKSISVIDPKKRPRTRPVKQSYRVRTDAKYMSVNAHTKCCSEQKIWKHDVYPSVRIHGRTIDLKGCAQAPSLCILGVGHSATRRRVCVF